MTARGSFAVLLVEDDASLRRVLADELSRAGHRVLAQPDATRLQAAVEQHSPEVVLLDLNLPEVDGMTALGQLVAQDPELPVIVFTGHGTVELAVQAMHRGAFDFLTKPVSLDVLEQAILRAGAHARLLRENRLLRVAASGTGQTAAPAGAESEAARKLERQVDRMARAEQSVLVTGESGSGKELVARRLHALSPRANQPFVVVHCGAVPRQLIESELFGHVKGAFTGAEQKRQGLFEAADKGTLFLDEVGELPLDLQPALLRAVQFGEIRPVGSDRVRNVDCRVIAATHRDLRAKVADGSFREDLFYRLAVLELQVPPLRERREDIPALAAAFLAREGQRSGRRLTLSPDAVARLQDHPWPGNVRELENAVVRLGVLADDDRITAATIEELVLGSRPATAGGTRELPALDLDELENLAVKAALKRSGGNKVKAAQILGIATKTLYNKLAAMGDDAPPAGE
ncbi:MAG: hypothetical protein RL398_585 [Planctomycetota bacterium]